MYNTRPTWVEINTDNIRYNFANIKKLLKENTKICAVVKANAYGHGALEYARVLVSEGTDYLAVATLEEALELRKGGIEVAILILGYTSPQGYSRAIEEDIDITLYSWQAAEEISKVAIKNNKKARIHIKLDTGMSRLGYQADKESAEEIYKISKLEGLEIVGIFSHFAKADEESKEETHEQFRKFKYILDLLEELGVKIPIKHICNSAGIMEFPEYHMDMVRPGIILYGHYPSDEVRKEVLEIKPVMTLRTTLSHVKTIEAGRGVSYGHVYVTSESKKVGTMPIGYADGFTRLLTGKISVKIKDKMFPLIGRICMDQSMVDLEALDFKVGDIVTIFSEDEDLGLERLAKALGTINYEVLCMTGRRIPRVYLKEKRVLHIEDYLLK